MYLLSAFTVNSEHSRFSRYVCYGFQLRLVKKIRQYLPVNSTIFRQLLCGILTQAQSMPDSSCDHKDTISIFLNSKIRRRQSQFDPEFFAGHFGIIQLQTQYISGAVFFFDLHISPGFINLNTLSILWRILISRTGFPCQIWIIL